MKNQEIIIENLKSEGYRITKARESIIRILCNEGHYTIEDIINKLKELNGDVNIATVYNNINFLINESIIIEYNFNGSAPVYELNIGLHAHLVCNRCKSIQNIGISGLANLKNIVESNTGFIAKETKLDFYGTCKSCIEIEE